MTQDQFQQRYHEFITQDRAVAQAEADKANAEGIDNDTAVTFFVVDVGWGLLLKSVAVYLKENCE